MPRPRPPHLHREETRHGAVIWYVRKGHGRRIRIKPEYDSLEFWSEYRAALESAPKPSKAAKANTLAGGSTATAQVRPGRRSPTPPGASAKTCSASSSRRPAPCR